MNSAMRVDDVCAVIVAYRPELALLREVVACVVGQVGRLLIFDNASMDMSVDYDGYLSEVGDGYVTVLRSEENVGLGAAINHAARFAAEAGFSYLLILDQDSLLDPDMVQTLRSRLVELQAGMPVAAVGACFRDVRTGEQAPFVKIGFPLNRKLYGSPGEVIDCDFLISSGSLIPLTVLETVGGMDAGLFIDNVDLEWSFRAKYHGYRLYGICDAGMRHRIGDRLRKVPLLRHPVVVHGPLRLYYMMRNRVILYRRRETPGRWIAQDVPRLLLKLVGMSLFVTPRLENARRMLQGLWHGVRGRLGRYPD
ncbi:MAG: glycosyltransferase family 2 protein [Xanthomonadaceae bacterium]|jgi:rhamnosyltransferase|nr:glycosyltransferase family 2 protein [Xanthomonadaceae bacterium]